MLAGVQKLQDAIINHRKKIRKIMRVDAVSFKDCK